MAYRPSFRRHMEPPSTELNLTPVMNLMVVLIPLLLSSAQFIKIGIIELNLPPAAGATSLAGEKPKEEYRALDLTVSITNNGFYVSSALTERENAKEKTEVSPDIPLMMDGSFDYAALSQTLYGLKQQADNRFRDKEAIVIQAEGDISYQVLVGAMDASRMAQVDGRTETLFPKVSLSAGIF